MSSDMENRKVQIIEYGDLNIDINCRQVKKSGRIIALRRKEFDILILLTEHPGWVYTKEQIFESVWKGELPIDIDNAVTCQIKHLRKKIGNNLVGTPYIETVWGVGYKFNYK